MALTSGPQETVRSRARRMAAPVLLSLGSVVAALALAELTLRVVDVSPETYGVYPPRYHLVMQPDPALLPGVRGGPKNFTMSAAGLRGRDTDPRANEYRILAIGGSTTECIVLDDADTWTALLEKDLAAVDGRRVWVGGAGRSGLNTRDHIIQLKYLSAALPRIDAVIVLTGVNDLTLALSEGDQYAPPPPLSDPEEEYRQVRRAFNTIPRSRRLSGPPPARWYQHLVLYDVARRTRGAILASRRMARQDSRGNSVARWRAARRAAPNRIDTLPDLTVALEEYRRNLRTLAAMAVERHQRLLFATQPVFWRADLGAADQERLWLGGVGEFLETPSNTYYTARVLRAAMDRFNEAILAVCVDARVECVDLAKEIPSDPKRFYDDVHFTEAGAHDVSAALVRYFKSHPPTSSEQDVHASSNLTSRQIRNRSWHRPGGSSQRATHASLRD